MNIRKRKLATADTKLTMRVDPFCSTQFISLPCKETILGSRKSEYQQKVLSLRRPLFFQNLFIESWFLNGSKAPLATISVLKKFHCESI